MNVEAIFGERTWDDLRSTLERQLRTRCPRVPHASIEDAVSEAIADLLMGWVYAPSSVVPGDPDLTWRGALHRGMRKAQEALHMDMAADMPIEVDVASPETGFWFDPGVPGPEDEVIESMGHEPLRRLLDDTPPEEFESWLTDFMAGKSVREAAVDQGVSHMTVQRRRANGLARLRERAAEYGVQP